MLVLSVQASLVCTNKEWKNVIILIVCDMLSGQKNIYIICLNESLSFL